MPIDFQNPFTDRLCGKFAIESLLNILPYLKYVATLPCEMFRKRPCSRTEWSKLPCKTLPLKPVVEQNNCKSSCTMTLALLIQILPCDLWLITTHFSDCR